MGGIYGCGCKEAYRFPHITYPYYIVLLAAVYLYRKSVQLNRPESSLRSQES